MTPQVGLLCFSACPGPLDWLLVTVISPRPLGTRNKQAVKTTGEATQPCSFPALFHSCMSPSLEGQQKLLSQNCQVPSSTGKLMVLLASTFVEHAAKTFFS